MYVLVCCSNCKRKDDPLRKMCLIKIRRLNVEVEDEGITQAKVTELTSVPTFGDVFSTMQSMGFEDNRIWYFLSSAGRLLGSLDWLQVIKPSSLLNDLMSNFTVYFH